MIRLCPHCHELHAPHVACHPARRELIRAGATIVALYLAAALLLAWVAQSAGLLR